MDVGTISMVAKASGKSKGKIKSMLKGKGKGKHSDGGKGGGKPKGGGKKGGKREPSNQRSRTQTKDHYGVYWKEVAQENNWCIEYAFGSCKKTEGTKGHENLNHVDKDVIRKEVEKRREAAKSRGVKPDGTGG